ncbi:MAG: hypothetical protein ACFFE8_13205 [Candidatus Heimdallarchaeota archaeon]
MYSTKATEKKIEFQAASKYCTKCGSSVGAEDFFCQACGTELAVRKPGNVYVPKPSRQETYRGYIQILGVVEIVFGVFALLIGMALLALAPLFNVLLRSGLIEEPETQVILMKIAPFLAVILFGVALVCLVYAFASIISGKRLMKYENSGRIGTMVIGALNLINLPFGTIFGIAALYLLSQPEVEQLYTQK